MSLITLNASRSSRWLATAAAALLLSACSKPAADAKDADDASQPAAPAETRLDAAVMKTAGVQLQTLATTPLQGQLRAPGEVVDNAYGTTLITPRVPALVIRRHAKMGDEVVAGAPLVTLSSPEVADAQAALQLAEQEWRRMQALGRDLVSGRRYGEAQVALEQARAKARAYGLPGAAAGRTNGEFTLSAPHAGRLTEDEFIVGQQIEPGQTLFRLVDEAVVWVDAKLPAEAAQRVTLGTPAQVFIGNEALTGKVVQRAHRTAEDTRTEAVRIEVANPDHRLQAGDPVEVRMEMAGPATAQLVVPAAALTLLHGQTVAFRQSDDGVLEPVPVETGETIGSNTIVRAGLKPGDRVAVTGVYALKSYLLRSQLGDVD